MFLNELANKEIDEAFLLAKNKIDEYPTCYKLLLNCAAVLKGMLCIEDRQVDELCKSLHNSSYVNNYIM